MELALCYILVVLNMREIIMKEKDKEKVDFKVQMEKFMMENGSKACDMEVESGKAPKVTSMWENGKKIK